MRKMQYLLAALFLLATAVAVPAQEEIAITPKGLVKVGTVLHFSAYLKYQEAQCEDPWTGKELRFFIACETGNGWWTEFITPDKNAGWKWYNYTKTYTVTQADIDNPQFCFMLYADSGCWAGWHGWHAEEICPQTKFVIPRIRLQKYLDCSRIPGCPNCLRLELGELTRTLGDPVERVQVVLLRNGRRFALLGEAGQGLRLPAQFKISLPAAGPGLSQARRADMYRLQVLGKNGQVLASGEVVLRLR